METQEVVNTLGLSPAELTNISGQQIQRDQNVLRLLGHQIASAAQKSASERNQALNQLTQAQTRELEPVEIEHEGQKFQTTRGNMINAMNKLKEMQGTQAQTARTEYENQPMSITINGEPFEIRRHELKDISGMLAEQERLKINSETEARAKQEQQWRSEGIEELADPKKPITAQTAAKLQNLPAWLASQRKSLGSKEALEHQQKLRKAWNGVNVELNKPPEGRAKNPLALASSANALAEELGEPIATVVFSDRFIIPGLGNDIKSGAYKMDDLKNPMTGERISIKELREQAEADGMNLNDALMILYINQHMKGQ